MENELVSNVVKTTLLIAYTPLGVLICTFRFFLAIQTCVVLSILPEEFILSRLIRAVTSVILGIFVKREGFSCRQQNTRVFVAYRDTHLAHIAARIALPVIILHPEPLLMGWLFGQVKSGDTTYLRYEGEKILNKRIEVRPLLSLTSSNNSFVLDEWPFFLHQPIHPISITKYNPFLPSYIRLPSSPLLDLLFVFFFPITKITVRMSPCIRRVQQEMTQEFRRKVMDHFEELIAGPPTRQPPSDTPAPRQMIRQPTIPSERGQRDDVLQERKRALFTNNQEKFIEKHGNMIS